MRSAERPWVSQLSADGKDLKTLGKSRRGCPADLTQPEPGVGGKAVGGSIADIAQRVLLEQYAPSAVVIDENGDILYVSGRTGKYLELPPGKTTWNLCAMAREGLRYELSAAMRKASAENAEVFVKGVSVITDAGHQFVDLSVRPFSQPEGLAGLLLVIFKDTISLPQSPDACAEAAESCPHCQEFERELRRTKFHLQTTIEEMQFTQERMLSANEEFQSTNEELHSSNEELMTSKEELQSLNEELNSLNVELQTRNGELTGVNNDMVNLLNSTQIATIFLDTDLNIRRFTPSVVPVVNLRQSDIGRPLEEIAPNLTYDALITDARIVLDTLVAREAQVMTKEGLWFAMRMMPYRTLDNVIDGVVVTFTDITVPKQLEEAERDAKSRELSLRSKLQVQHGEMQQALLPGEIPAFDGCDIATKFVSGTAGEQIGGDFYDVFKTADGKTAVLIGDVAGKGIEAGGLAAAARSTVRAYAYELASPGAVLAHTNSVLCGQSFTHDRFVTAFLGIFDPETGGLDYSSAGHPPAMILRAGGRVELLTAGSLPIRVQDNVDYDSLTAELAPGDKLVMYTDGISEARKHSHILDIDGVKNILSKSDHSGPQEIIDKLFCVACDICQGKDGTLTDDAAVIVLQRQT